MSKQCVLCRMGQTRGNRLVGDWLDKAVGRLALKEKHPCIYTNTMLNLPAHTTTCLWSHIMAWIHLWPWKTRKTQTVCGTRTLSAVLRSVLFQYLARLICKYMLKDKTIQKRRPYIYIYIYMNVMNVIITLTVSPWTQFMWIISLFNDSFELKQVNSTS